MTWNLTKAKLTDAFSKLGRKGVTAPPESTDNRHTEAYEFAIASALRSAANSRYEAAKKVAEQVGLLSKPEPGSEDICYQNEHILIVAKTNNPARRLDETLLFNSLAKKLGSDEARKLINAAKKESAPATSFTIIPAQVTNEIEEGEEELVD